MAYVPKKGPKKYNLEKDIEGLGKRGKKKTAPKKVKKLNWAQRLKQKVKDYMSGEGYKKEAKAKRKAEMDKYHKAKAAGKTDAEILAARKKTKSTSTKRTKKVTGKLRGAGLTEKEISKLKGKKRK